jgi:hypothetical protein
MKKTKELSLDKHHQVYSKYKIMWILKEGNISYEENEQGIALEAGFLSDWHKEKSLSIPLFIKMIYASYGILNPEKEWSELSYANADAYEAIKHVRYIHINKYAASVFSDYSLFQQAYARNKKELLNQIESCDPDIIIYCGTWSVFEIDVFNSIGWDVSASAKRYFDINNTGTTTSYYVFSPNKFCINAYHPNYPDITDKAYWHEIKTAVRNWEVEISQTKKYFG